MESKIVNIKRDDIAKIVRDNPLAEYAWIAAGLIDAVIANPAFGELKQTPELIKSLDELTEFMQKRKLARN